MKIYSPIPFPNALFATWFSASKKGFVPSEAEMREMEQSRLCVLSGRDSFFLVIAFFKHLRSLTIF